MKMFLELFVLRASPVRELCWCRDFGRIRCKLISSCVSRLVSAPCPRATTATPVEGVWVHGILFGTSFPEATTATALEGLFCATEL
jgi:hypothetical protein